MGALPTEIAWLVLISTIMVIGLVVIIRCVGWPCPSCSRGQDRAPEHSVGAELQDLRGLETDSAHT